MSQQDAEESKVIPKLLELRNGQQAARQQVEVLRRKCLAKVESTDQGKQNNNCASPPKRSCNKKVNRIGSETERASWRAAKQKWRSSKKRKKIGNEEFLVSENRMAAEQM
jgi:hypothetical protein